MGPGARAAAHLFASGDGYFLELPVAVFGVGADGQTWWEGERSGQPAALCTHHTGALQRAPAQQFTLAQTAHPPFTQPVVRARQRDCQNLTPSTPVPPSPAPPWQAASVQVSAWAWRDPSSESRLVALHLPPCSCRSPPLAQVA